MNKRTRRVEGSTVAEPWNVPDKWSVSPFSFADEVRDGYDLPEGITIRDVTLYEGQHQPGARFNPPYMN